MLLLSLSASGTVLILIMFLIKAPVLRRLRRNCQYYLWLIVIARLLIPFSPELSLMNSGFHVIDEKTGAVTISEIQQHNYNSVEPVNGPEEVKSSNTGEITQSVSSADKSINWRLILEGSCITLWALVSIIILIYKVRTYCRFTRYIKKYSTEVSDIKYMEILGNTMEHMKIDHHIGLYTNSNVSSPMLIGFFHSSIVFPSLDIADADYQYTLIHELTHYKKKDMFYKWLVQLTICIHWFNPLVHLMSKEIDNTCELACDETVITRMDDENRINYGDMLLNAARPEVIKQSSLAAVTLIDNKKILKERLKAIMNKKQRSITTVIITVSLVVILGAGSVLLGTYNASADSTDEETTTDSNIDYSRIYGGNCAKIDFNDDTVTSYQSSFYCNPYIIKISITNPKSDYTTKTQFNGITVYFSDECKAGVNDKDFIDAMKKMVSYLTTEFRHKDITEDGFISVTYYKNIGTDVTSAFEESYANKDKQVISALSNCLTESVRSEYLAKAYEEGDEDIFSIIARYASQSVREQYAQKALEDNKKEFYNILDGSYEYDY